MLKLNNTTDHVVLYIKALAPNLCVQKSPLLIYNFSGTANTTPVTCSFFNPTNTFVVSVQPNCRPFSN